jgi:hypothetical protein
VSIVPFHITWPAQLSQFENELSQPVKQSPHPPQGSQLLMDWQAQPRDFFLNRQDWWPSRPQPESHSQPPHSGTQLE